MRIQENLQVDLEHLGAYIQEVCNTLVSQQLQTANFLRELTTPIQRSPILMLNQLQTSEIGSYDHFETIVDQNAFPVSSIDVYLDIERLREE